MSPDDHELEPLLARVMAGDGQAFNELFARLRPFLHALVRRRLGPSPGPIDNSALVQSSLRRIFENLDDLRDDPSVPHFFAWVRRIVYNRVTDELRRAGRTPVVRADNLDVTDPKDPQEEAGRRRRAARLAAALARLPERQRLVVEWHWFDRLRDAEISARLGGSVSAVRVLRCRALKALRQHLESFDDDQ
jgi:RNA polymerase sigma-70 factor (ECF subfamily)